MQTSNIYLLLYHTVHLATSSGIPATKFPFYVSCMCASQTRAVLAQLIARANVAGFTAVVVSGDRPVIGRREADLRNHYELAPRLTTDKVISSTGARIGPREDGTLDLVSIADLVN